MFRKLSPEKVAALRADYLKIYECLLETGLTPESPDYNTNLPTIISDIACSLHGKEAKAAKYAARRKPTLGLNSQPTLGRVVAIQDALLKNDVPLAKAEKAIVILDEYICHHIDEDKLNDVPSNLVLLDSSSTHGRMRGLETGLAIEVIAAARITLRIALASVA